MGVCGHGHHSERKTQRAPHHILGTFLSTTTSLCCRFHHLPSLLVLRALNDHHPSGWVHCRRMTRLSVPPHPRATYQLLRSPCRQLTTTTQPYLIVFSTEEMVRISVYVAIVGLHCSEERASQTSAHHLDLLTRGTVHGRLIQRHPLLLCALPVRMKRHMTTSSCHPLCRTDKTLRPHLQRDVHNRKVRSNARQHPHRQHRQHQRSAFTQSPTPNVMLISSGSPLYLPMQLPPTCRLLYAVSSNAHAPSTFLSLKYTKRSPITSTIRSIRSSHLFFGRSPTRRILT